MLIELNPAVIGVLSSVVTEILKLFPKLSENMFTKALTAIVVMIVGTYLFTNGLTISNFGVVAVSSFVFYGALLQPAAKFAGIRTQSKA